MSANPHLCDEQLVDMLRELALARMGLRSDALRLAAVHRVLRSLLAAGWDRPRIARGALGADPRVLAHLARELTVAETYFFRGAQELEHVARATLDAERDDPERPLRVWSAGCATGEEAYSLAAILSYAGPSSRPTPRLDVLGTDLVERNIDVARRGRYDRKASRTSAPTLHPVLHPAGDGQVEVDAELRSVTRFAVHDLLDPPLEVGFDLVVCRNVLIYLNPEAVRRVTGHLAASLAPGGVLLVGAVDVIEAWPDLERVGPAEIQMYRRSGAAVVRRRAVTAGPGGGAAAPEPAEVTPSGETPSEPAAASAELSSVEAQSALVAEHLRVLEALEACDHDHAEQLLSRLCARAPDYLPGLVERARMLLRRGERRTAIRLFREASERADALPADEVLAGPSPLPARFYQRLVRTYLERNG